MVKPIPMRSPMEMRNVLLDNGGKEVPVIKRQGTWLNCVWVLVLPERFSAKETSKQSVKEAAWFFLNTCSKIWQRELNWRWNCVVKTIRTWRFRNFQPVHITKNESTKGGCDLLMRWSVSVSQGSNEPPQQRPEIEIEYQQKDGQFKLKRIWGCGTK